MQPSSDADASAPGCFSLDRKELTEKRLPVRQAKRGAAEIVEAGEHWNELLDAEGVPRPPYHRLLDRFAKARRSELRRLDDQLEATMREMGVTFDVVRDRPWGRRPWYCDLLPQIFTADEWKPLAQGMAQRLHAFECFLRDIYGEQRILRQEILPLQPILGSPHYQRAARGLPAPGGSYLHISGMAVGRDPEGRLIVKHHYFSHASGISYMIQNRRAMARVLPQLFEDHAVQSIAAAPTEMLEALRSFARESDPTVVLLSSGQGSAAYSEHSFLSRRMGIALVQGGDLLVLNDQVYLKTVTGLERVEVIYSRISDHWLDPLVFRSDSLLGVPGLVQCIRKGTVSVINAVGSQLADDRALLAYAPTLIRYYLGEAPILEGLETLWLGDLDIREMVLGDLGRYVVRPVYGERILTPDEGERFDERRRRAVIKEIMQDPGLYVAQPRGSTAVTLCHEGGEPRPRHQDHILFAVRRGEGDYRVFPGALTRISAEGSTFPASEQGGGSKDTWVEAIDDTEPSASTRILRDVHPPSQHVTSRVAEAFYWIGRYLERARGLAGMISVIEALETEELNRTERALYRPVWNRMLPLLEGDGNTRRNISSPAGRFRLALDVDESGTVVSSVKRAAWNAESILECLSMEAWSVLSRLRSMFANAQPGRNRTPEQRIALTRRICDQTCELVAQFFGVAQASMIEDGGWRFCEIGQMIEQAAITANAVDTMTESLLRATGPEREHAREIQISAFLRLLNSRDVYRRVYQMRVEPAAMLDMLWSNPVVPRSVARCMRRCESLLSAQTGDSPGLQRTLIAIEDLCSDTMQVDWEALVEREIEQGPFEGRSELATRVREFLDRTLGMHHLISDAFLNHQIHMRGPEQPMLAGFGHAV